MSRAEPDGAREGVILRPLGPVDTAGLFPPLHGELIGLLRGLTPSDWSRPTVAGHWRVRDVVAHLLDVDLRRLSATRDGHLPAPPEPIGSYGELVRFLNRLNADWVAASQRLSPRVLIELLSLTGPLVAETVAALPPHDVATFPVAWAGERESENWFDVGRDYTERWHHQMQIRDAIGAPLLLERRWLYPLLDLSFRALPYTYRDVDASTGTRVAVHVTGEAGGTWWLERESAGWHLHRGAAPARLGVGGSDRVTAVTLDPDVAWRMLYNAVPADQVRARAVVSGDPSLADPLFAARSVMV